MFFSFETPINKLKKKTSIDGMGHILKASLMGTCTNLLVNRLRTQLQADEIYDSGMKFLSLWKLLCTESIRRECVETYNPKCERQAT